MKTRKRKAVSEEAPSTSPASKTPTVSPLAVREFEREISEESVQLVKDGSYFHAVTTRIDGLGNVKAHLPKSVETLDVGSVKSLKDLELKASVEKHVLGVNHKLLESKSVDGFTPLQSHLLGIFSNYQDLFYPLRTFETANEIRLAYCLHALNHAAQHRSAVVANSKKLQEAGGQELEFRDQGLTRPRILILVPFRDAAFRIVMLMAELLSGQGKANLQHQNRFLEEYAGPSESEPKKIKMPDDFYQIFAGNIDDGFRLGISVAKNSLRLFTDFYAADIILASPLGIRMALGAEGDLDFDFDFLSSIELVILDQADIFLMQNWSHVVHVFDNLNRQPLKSHETNFSRVRLLNLNGWAKFFRQTLIISSVVSAELKAIFNSQCQNHRGRLFVAENQAGTAAKIGGLGRLPLAFHRFECANPSEQADKRFAYFVDKLFGDLRRQGELASHSMIVIPSYFDFVRLRNLFKREDMNFVQICEYTENKKVSSARDLFFHGEKTFLLYTERFHFYRRYRIRGIRHIIFYQLPLYANFFAELCNMIEPDPEQGNSTVTILYSKLDALPLSGVLGTEQAAQIIKSERGMHLVVCES